MAADRNAFNSVASPSAFSGEFNQMDFVVRSIMNGMATTSLVQVKGVTAKDDGYEVSVQPMVSQVDGAGNALEHGIIHGIPVWRVQGGSSAVLVEPAEDDIGMVVFCSSDISGVKENKAPAPPGSFRKFDWADGIYMGGLPWKPATQFVRMDSAGVTIKTNLAVTVDAPTSTFTGDVVIEGSVTAGAGSSLGGKDFDNHKHSGVTAGSAETGGPV